MESVKSTRLILDLGKARVVERTANYMKLAIGGSTTVTVFLNLDNIDVREGDILTIYTEVLYAPPQPTPVQ